MGCVSSTKQMLYTKNTYYKDNTLHEKYTYVKNTNFKNDRKKHGFYVSYYSNGNLKYKCFYVFGEVHGRVQSWYVNGQKEKNLYKISGKLLGDALYYYPDGNIRMICNYDENGNKHGELKKWRENGSLLYIEQWLNGDPLFKCKYSQKHSLIHTDFYLYVSNYELYLNNYVNQIKNSINKYTGRLLVDFNKISFVYKHANEYYDELFSVEIDDENLRKRFLKQFQESDWKKYDYDAKLF